MDDAQQIRELQSVRDHIVEYAYSIEELVTEIKAGSINNKLYCAEAAEQAMEDIISEVATAQRIIQDIIRS